MLCAATFVQQLTLAKYLLSRADISDFLAGDLATGRAKGGSLEARAMTTNPIAASEIIFSLHVAIHI
jgi:hypothetical protein